MNGIDYIRLVPSVKLSYLIGEHIKKQTFQQRNEPGKPDDNFLHYVKAEVFSFKCRKKTNYNSYYERMHRNDNNEVPQ